MQPYEFKVVKIVPFKGTLSQRVISESEIEDKINVLGRVGWNLVSTTHASLGGATKEIILFFSREAQKLEEMV